MTNNKEGGKIKTDPDVRINRKDIKTVIILVFHMFKNLGRDMKDMKKTSKDKKIKLLKIKNMSEMKTTWEWIKSGLEQ